MDEVRLFVGITAPEEWKTAIRLWRRGVQSQFSDSFGRWTSDQNLHLTFRFFGSVEDTQAAAIDEALQKVAAVTKPFSISAAGLGCFPNASRPRIVWLGLDGAGENLTTLEERVRPATAHFGQPPEDRPFHPHLTLARVKVAQRPDRDVLAELTRKGPTVEVPQWRINELELIRSEPTPGGSIYTILATYPFSA